MTVNRQWLLAARPDGMIGPQNFGYVETAIPEISNGEVLVKNLYLSFDPTQRNWMVDRPGYLPPVAIGETMRAGSVSQVVDSKHNDFAVGELVQTTGCWQDYAVVAPGQGPTGINKLPPGVSPEMMLSILGITGMTAYFGLLEHGQPKAGETVLVSGAAGATGSVVGQIAKLMGCRVVGIAGGPEKCAWLKEVAGFDAVIDYKNEDVDEQIGIHCPDKWDVFFDNVGGSNTGSCAESSQFVLPRCYVRRHCQLQCYRACAGAVQFNEPCHQSWSDAGFYHPGLSTSSYGSDWGPNRVGSIW